MKINFDMEGRIKIQRKPFCIELLIKKNNLVQMQTS